MAGRDLIPPQDGRGEPCGEIVEHGSIWEVGA